MKKVRVQFIGIRVMSVGPDPGMQLEIYGDLYVRRVFMNASGQPQEAERHVVFHKASGDAVDITLGHTHLINAGVDVTIQRGEFLWLGGHLAEHDSTSANDNLGFIDQKIPHDLIRDFSANDPLVVSFNESNQIAEALFQITVFFHD